MRNPATHQVRCRCAWCPRRARERFDVLLLLLDFLLQRRFRRKSKQDTLHYTEEVVENCNGCEFARGRDCIKYSEEKEFHVEAEKRSKSSICFELGGLSRRSCCRVRLLLLSFRANLKLLPLRGARSVGSRGAHQPSPPCARRRRVVRLRVRGWLCLTRPVAAAGEFSLGGCRYPWQRPPARSNLLNVAARALARPRLPDGRRVRARHDIPEHVPPQRKDTHCSGWAGDPTGTPPHTNRLAAAKRRQNTPARLPPLQDCFASPRDHIAVGTPFAAAGASWLRLPRLNRTNTLWVRPTMPNVPNCRAAKMP